MLPELRFARRYLLRRYRLRWIEMLSETRGRGLRSWYARLQRGRELRLRVRQLTSDSFDCLIRDLETWNEKGERPDPRPRARLRVKGAPRPRRYKDRTSTSK